MTARLLTTSLAIALGLSASAAVAQSYTAPAGIPAALAPGGLEGRAAGVNLLDATDGRGRVLGEASRGAYGRDVTTGSVRRSGGKTAW